MPFPIVYGGCTCAESPCCWSHQPTNTHTHTHILSLFHTYTHTHSHSHIHTRTLTHTTFLGGWRQRVGRSALLRPPLAGARCDRSYGCRRNSFHPLVLRGVPLHALPRCHDNRSVRLQLLAACFAYEAALRPPCLCQIPNCRCLPPNQGGRCSRGRRPQTSDVNLHVLYLMWEIAPHTAAGTCYCCPLPTCWHSQAAYLCARA